MSFIVREGDPTTTGGFVLSASASEVIDLRRVARMGDLCGARRAPASVLSPRAIRRMSTIWWRLPRRDMQWSAAANPAATA